MTLGAQVRLLKFGHEYDFNSVMRCLPVLHDGLQVN
jgi:hypothetical protein